MDFLERFRQYSKVQLVPQDHVSVLLAISGGVDSMVMLHCFQQSGLTFGIAHCNFQLRGQESDGDEKFVQEIAAGLGVPFFTKRFDTNTYATENGISTQMAARDLRYAWFAELAAAHNYGQLATAHNLNDSVETALLNFVRGTGLQGMTGIRQEDSAFLIRPLLFATRDEILEFAHAGNIAWREDSSNASDDYGRNFLRHHVVPQMQELNPNFLHTAERNLLRLRDTMENYDFLLRQFLGMESRGQGEEIGSYSIDKQKLMQFPAPHQALHEMLKPHGFTKDQASQMAEKLDQIGFMLHADSGWTVLCERNDIMVRPSTEAQQITSLTVQENDLMVRLDNGVSLFFMPAEVAPPFPDGRTAIVIDSANIQYPLRIRAWREGDVFQPFGMGGKSQKLQDFFTNQKLSRFEKEKVKLLLNGDGAVIWVIGYRLDERFRIGPETFKGLKISCL